MSRQGLIVTKTKSMVVVVEAIQAVLVQDKGANRGGPSAQYLSTLVPNTSKGMVLGIRDLKYWVLGPSG